MEVRAKCRSVKLTKSSKHTRQDPSFQVAAEMYVDSKGEHFGQTYVWYGSLKGGAVAITERALREMGYAKPLAQLGSVQASDLPKQVRMTLEPTERGGWRARSIFPLQRDLGESLSKGEEELLTYVLVAAEEAKNSAEPGTNDEPDEEDAKASRRGRRTNRAEAEKHPFDE